MNRNQNKKVEQSELGDLTISRNNFPYFFFMLNLGKVRLGHGYKCPAWLVITRERVPQVVET